MIIGNNLHGEVASRPKPCPGTIVSLIIERQRVSQTIKAFLPSFTYVPGRTRLLGPI
jgi:hypothetical protein